MRKGCSTFARTRGFGFILRPFDFVHRILIAVAAVCEVFGVLGARLNDLALSLISRVTPHARLVPVQEIGQTHRVMDIRGRGRDRVDDFGPAIDADVRLHPKEPLVAFFHLNSQFSETQPITILTTNDLISRFYYTVIYMKL